VSQFRFHFSSCNMNAMSLSTRLMPRPSAEGRGLFSAIATGERLGSSPFFRLVALMVLRIRKLGLTVLATATLCSTISRLVAADPSVEVYTQDSVVTSSTAEADTNLLAYVPRFSVSIGSGYDDNVNIGSGVAGPATKTGSAGSAFTQTHVTLSKDLRMERTQLNIKIGAGVVYYFDRPGRSTDITGTLDVSLKHNVSERLMLDAIINAAYLTEPDFSTDLGPQRRANYFSTEDTLTASYKWSSRLSTDSSYLLRLVDYQNNSGNSENSGNGNQNRVENTFKESLRYRWSPRTILTTEYRFGLIDYGSSLRNSSLQTALLGFDYEINSRLNATFRGGATFRTYEDATRGERTDPSLSGSLHYIIGPSANVYWTASYGSEEPSGSVSSVSLSRTTVRTGLQLTYGLTKRLTPHLTLNYHHDENESLSASGVASGTPGAGQGAFTNDALELVLGAKYAVTNRVALDLGFTHSQLGSGGPTIGYSRNRYSVGLTISY
jgi:opacity protein-like surface antigen